MRIGFYAKLAFDGIRKNKRMYLPYLLTCIGMVMMYYIIIFMRYNDNLSAMHGGSTIREFMSLGSLVIAVFAGIFLFYTNSFLIRRRKKEFGLYNILGMGKRNIGIILFWEALIISIISLGIGLIFGIVFSKIAELGLINIMAGEINYSFKISIAAIFMTVVVFGIIFGMLFLNSLRQIKFSSAIALIQSENVGEKPPKANWFLGILGVLILSAAYVIAVKIEDPLTALVLFFVAVIMVIAGTYLIMIAGSVLFCRILQKKKNYYYKPNHFVSVSSMVYRMKRNGAGLASICILATMVLVMISSTTCLYFGEEGALRERYSREINIEFRLGGNEKMPTEYISEIRNEILKIANGYNITPQNVQDYCSVSFAGLLEGNTIELDAAKVNEFNMHTYSNVYQIYIIPISDYNTLMGTNETLENGEAIICTYHKEKDYNFDTISFINGQTFNVKKVVDNFALSGDAAISVVPIMTIFVPDLEYAVKGIDKLADYSGNRMIHYKWTYNFDTGIEAKEQSELKSSINKQLKSAIKERFIGSEPSLNYDFYSFSVENREEQRADFYSLYGGLFYLGIILSIVFIFAAVLIIYYKQISEGYEDQSRFEIMQNVGMTKKEIRRSINSQLLTVFFLPLFFAGLHLIFAFPVIQKLLLLFQLNNVALFAKTTIISFAVFTLFYTLIYRITSNAYYNIVSGAKEKTHIE